MSSEEAEFWNEYKRKGRERAWQMADWAIDQLIKQQVPYVQMDSNSAHYRVAWDWDFWPTTGTYIHRPTGRRGHGVKNLIRDWRAKNGAVKP